MKAGKKEKKQVELVNAWNEKHEPGIEVIVKMDDKTKRRTKTMSKAYMLGAYRDYPGHTAVIWLDDKIGCYMLERVRVC